MSLKLFRWLIVSPDFGWKKKQKTGKNFKKKQTKTTFLPILMVRTTKKIENHFTLLDSNKEQQKYLYVEQKKSKLEIKTYCKF